MDIIVIGANPQNYAALVQIVQQLSDQSISAELFTHKQIKQKYPCLYTDDLMGGSYCDLDADADPYGVMEGYYKKCLKARERALF